MKLPGMTSPWAVCGVLLLATLLNYMDRQTLAVTLPTLKQEYNLAEGRVGMVEGCFGFAFAAGSILFGWMADRVGPRRLYPIVLAGWSLAGIATAGAGQPWIVAWFETTGDAPGTGVFRWLLLCRTALGLFEAGHWPCALLTVRAILAARDRHARQWHLAERRVDWRHSRRAVRRADRPPGAVLGISVLVDRSGRPGLGSLVAVGRPPS